MNAQRVTLTANNAAVAVVTPAENSYGKSVVLYNTSAEEVHIGGTAAECEDTTKAFPLAAGGVLSLELDENEKVFARAINGVLLTRKLCVLVSR